MHVMALQWYGRLLRWQMTRCSMRPIASRVNSICPGFIWTPMVENHFAGMGDVAEGRKAVDALHPLVHVGEADDIAWGAVYLAFDEAKFVTGAKLVIDGGYTARWYQEFTPVKRAGTEGKTS